MLVYCFLEEIIWQKKEEKQPKDAKELRREKQLAAEQLRVVKLQDVLQKEEEQQQEDVNHPLLERA